MYVAVCIYPHSITYLDAGFGLAPGVATDLALPGLVHGFGEPFPDVLAHPDLNHTANHKYNRVSGTTVFRRGKKKASGEGEYL